MIRAATLDDARAIAEVHVASWRAGYRGLLPDEYLAGLSLPERVALWETILTDGRTVVLIASGDPIAGFVAFHPERAEIGALYVHPSRVRTGVGTALLAAAHERLAGKPEIALWILEGNDAARAFYERHGYAIDGTTSVHEPTGRVQLRMARATRE